MKRQISTLALAGLFAASPATVQAGKSHEPAGGRNQAASDESPKGLGDRENEHDAAALRRILDDQFITTSGAGKPGNKESFIKSLTAGKADPRQSQSLTDESVVVDGDTAVVVGTDTFHRTDGAKPDGLALRYTITFIRRDGRWRALAEHIVKISD